MPSAVKEEESFLDCLALEMEAAWPFEMLWIAHQNTQCHISEVFHL